MKRRKVFEVDLKKNLTKEVEFKVNRLIILWLCIMNLDRDGRAFKVRACCK